MNYHDIRIDWAYFWSMAKGVVLAVYRGTPYLYLDGEPGILRWTVSVSVVDPLTFEEGEG